MRAFRTIAVAAALTACALPSPVTAQDLVTAQEMPAEPAVQSTDTAMAALSDRLSDPEFQAQMTSASQVLLSAMLDLEIGAFLDAVDEASGGAVSDKGRDIKPEDTLRDIAPDAEDFHDEVAEKLPQAMNAMSVMSEGMAELAPALKAMAERMRDAMDDVRANP